MEGTDYLLVLLALLPPAPTPAPFTATRSGISGGSIFSVSFTFDDAGDITSDTV